MVCIDVLLHMSICAIKTTEAREFRREGRGVMDVGIRVDYRPSKQRLHESRTASTKRCRLHQEGQYTHENQSMEEECLKLESTIPFSLIPLS